MFSTDVVTKHGDRSSRSITCSHANASRPNECPDISVFSPLMHGILGQVHALHSRGVGRTAQSGPATTGRSTAQLACNFQALAVVVELPPELVKVEGVLKSKLTLPPMRLA